MFRYLIRFSYTILLICVAPFIFASNLNNKNIYDTSIYWDDLNNRTKLLETVPTWSREDIDNIFQFYLQPDESSANETNNNSLYNIKFINSYWGPLDNPFPRVPRPAKVFAIADQMQTYSMALLIKDDADGNYYVFDKTKSQPILLNDWIANIKQENNLDIIHFNICLGYGNYPKDSCMGKSYQQETLDAQVKLLQNHRLNAIHPRNAYRPFDQDWQSIHDKIALNSNMSKNTIDSESIEWNDITARNKLLNTVVVWKNLSTIQANFERIRDLRYFNDEDYPGFMRRITWLYPDDGCWTRSAAVIRDFFGPLNNKVNEFQRPSKVFAFGNFCTNTPNAPKGMVTWGYHTAPMVKDAETNQAYVLDPSVDAKKPLTLEEWVSAITQTNDNCKNSPVKIEMQKFNICNGYGSNPDEPCADPNKVNFATETQAVTNPMNGQERNRYSERSRQSRLNRDPDLVLGDQPPWKDGY